jgi:S1-C subfamily serine protease
MAKSPKEVAKIAIPTTVQIIDSLTGGGSGVIIAKNGNTYTVLTANHVVKNVNSEYTIRTSKGKDYPVTAVESLQKSSSDPDLAIAKFQTSDEYPVAPISNSDGAEVGSGIYVSGYPLAVQAGAEREYEFSAGSISSRRQNEAQGYTMRYTAVTRRGMSGGPVFDTSGRVVGIHGQGESFSTVQSESGVGGQEELKTGFNAAIPINTFKSLMAQIGMSQSDLKVDNSAASDEPAREIPRNELNDLYKEFGLGIIRVVIRRFLPF